MKKSKLTPAQKKAKKAAYDKAYRERKKAQQVMPRIENEFPQSNFEKSFDHPIRTYWNLRFEKENSSCAKAGTLLNFEFIREDENGINYYRIKRGKRHFFTKSNELKPNE